MGDRVLFQAFRKAGTNEFGTSTEAELSPVVYGHWCGSRAPDICEKLQARMKGREGDVSYTAARLVQEVCAGDPDGHLSVGIWNAAALLTKEESHGDAGCVLIECTREGLRFKCVGGYLKANKAGTEVIA